jgi:hypothetical protein
LHEFSLIVFDHEQQAGRFGMPKQPVLDLRVSMQWTCPAMARRLTRIHTGNRPFTAATAAHCAFFPR